MAPGHFAMPAGCITLSWRGKGKWRLERCAQDKQMRQAEGNRPLRPCLATATIVLGLCAFAS